MQVPDVMEWFADSLQDLWVYDDGVAKGFVQVTGREVKKLFVEPVLQGQSIGAQLLETAIALRDADHLWALEKNTRAIAFYQRHGFCLTCERKLEEDTDEYLVRLERMQPTLKKQKPRLGAVFFCLFS